jgi:hypothetical protein
MVDGIVRQLTSGVVIECSAVCECMKNNPELVKAYDEGTGAGVTWMPNGCRKKNCQLSVPDHGDRCMAWPKDTSTWVIDVDVNKIKEIVR